MHFVQELLRSELTYFTYFVHVNTFSAYRLLQSISHIPIKSVWQKSHKSHCTVWISCTTLVDLQSGERIWQHHLPRQHLPVIAVTLNLCPHTLALAGILFNQTFFHRLLQVRPGPSRASKGQPLGIDESGLFLHTGCPFCYPANNVKINVKLKLVFAKLSILLYFKY